MSIRRFFQIRLFTALILMIAAGGLVGLNLREKRKDNGSFTRSEYGWPATAVEEDIWSARGAYRPDLGGLAFDVAFALVGLSGLSYACERVFRKRES